ncbi:MAG: sialate O-acetylesterase, partial [Verrucomicrobiota bacterium]
MKTLHLTLLVVFLSGFNALAAEKIKVFLLSGQSNMSGGGKLQKDLAFDEAIGDKVKIWDGCAYWKNRKAWPNRWVSLTEVQTLKKAIGRNWIGPEFGFAEV